MKRLVYSPRVDAYVKNDDGDILDISPYIVRGELTRVVNAVSTTSLTLRNPANRFTGSKNGPPLIRPMDPIVVTLTRLRDRPIQLFTGYVDSAPYIALFPGEVTLTASCTLKRLQYTYFDPGLQFFNEFLAAHGWQADQRFGIDSLPKANNAFTGKGDLKDPGLGLLLFDVLTEIGQWPASSIYIEQLPEGIVDLVSKLFSLGAKEAKENQTDFFDFLKKVLDTNTLGGSSVIPGGGTGNSKPPTHGIYGLSALEDLWIQAGGPRAVAPLMAHVAICESGGNPTSKNPHSPAAGLWQIDGAPFGGNVFDPLTNAKMAVAKYRSQGLGAWAASRGCWGKYQ